MPADLNIFRGFIESLVSDKRVTVWHMGMILGMVQLANGDKIEDPISISRKKVMQLGHINNIMTYHRCIKELQDFGYIKYYPSYHPGIRTTVYLMEK